MGYRPFSNWDAHPSSPKKLYIILVMIDAKQVPFILLSAKNPRTAICSPDEERRRTPPSPKLAPAVCSTRRALACPYCSMLKNKWMNKKGEYLYSFIWNWDKLKPHGSANPLTVGKPFVANCFPFCRAALKIVEVWRGSYYRGPFPQFCLLASEPNDRYIYISLSLYQKSDN